MAARHKAKTAIHGAKKKDFTVSLTPEAANLLDLLASHLNVSRSEFIERMARNQIVQTSNTDLLGECSAN